MRTDTRWHVMKMFVVGWYRYRTYSSPMSLRSATKLASETTEPVTYKQCVRRVKRGRCRCFLIGR
jgi:hypothetical protein